MTEEEQKAADAAKAEAEAKAKQEKSYGEDEVKKLIKERDAAKEKLRKIEEAEAKAAEEKLKQEGKLQELLSAKEAELAEEKKYADQFRALRLAKIASLKESMGDDFLPEYEMFSLESLEKISARSSSKPPTEGSRPGSAPVTRTLQDRYNEAVKSGNFTEQVRLKQLIHAESLKK